MSFRVRIYDAATEKLMGYCSSENVASTLRLYPNRGMLLRDEDGKLLGFAQPTEGYDEPPTVRWPE